MDPKDLDEQVVRPTDSEFKELLESFVLVRVLDMKDVDIAKFQFDYDLVFAVVFMSAEGQVYGRYGGRDALSDNRLVSLEGLKFTMRSILGTHRLGGHPAEPESASRFARDLFPTRTGGCMHCHHVFEGLRREEKRNGTFDPEAFYVYPLPRNIGLKLDVDQGNKVVQVTDDSAAGRAGIRPGDVLRRIGQTPVFSQADVMWALHNAPREGSITVQTEGGGTTSSIVLSVERGWKKTNLSWRASMQRESILHE